MSHVYLEGVFLLGLTLACSVSFCLTNLTSIQNLCEKHVHTPLVFPTHTKISRVCRLWERGGAQVGKESKWHIPVSVS